MQKLNLFIIKICLLFVVADPLLYPKFYSRCMVGFFKNLITSLNALKIPDDAAKVIAFSYLF